MTLAEISSVVTAVLSLRTVRVSAGVYKDEHVQAVAPLTDV